jgi:hypothetical protein
MSLYISQPIYKDIYIYILYIYIYIYIYIFVSKFFTEFGKILTFAGGQVEVKVNNVGALMVASGGAKLGGDLWLKKGVR